MKRIHRSNWNWKGFEGTLQHRRHEFQQRHSGEQLPSLLTVAIAELKSVYPHKSFVLDQATAHQWFFPHPRRWFGVLCQTLGQENRGVEVDQGSDRSASSPERISSRVMTPGAVGNGPAPIKAGCKNPLRTASARKASATKGARVSRGGTSSATTRSRSEIKIVSPPAARRTYSLNLFLRTFKPTDRIQLG